MALLSAEFPHSQERGVEILKNILSVSTLFIYSWFANNNLFSNAFTYSHLLYFMILLSLKKLKKLYALPYYFLEKLLIYDPHYVTSIS